MKIIRLGLLFILLLMNSVVQAECVILLHGLTRSSDSMKTLETALSKNNYTVVNVDYPSTDYGIEILTEKTIEPAITKCPKYKKINFVTHSLGGILVRYYLNKNQNNRLNKVVMLGPPNNGSEVVDKLKTMPGFYAINGDAGLQLGTDAFSIPKTLGKANFELGIIAGNKSINWFLSMLIPGDDDGKVSIESSKLSGMRDHIILPVTHPFMMKNKEVIKQVISFLQDGRFSHKIETNSI